MKLQASPATEAAALALGESMIDGREIPEVVAELMAEGVRHQIHRTRYTPAENVTDDDMARALYDQIRMWRAFRNQINDILRDDARTAVKFHGGNPDELALDLGIDPRLLID